MAIKVRIMFIFQESNTWDGSEAVFWKAGSVLFLNLVVVTQKCLLFNNYQAVLRFGYLSLYRLYFKNKIK